MDQQAPPLEIEVNHPASEQQIVVLYEALIHNARIAIAEISASEKPHNRVHAAYSIARCINILTELTTSFNRQFGPELGNKLSDLYLLFTREFSEAFEKSEPERIRSILPMLIDLKKTWIKAEQLPAALQTESV